MPLAPAAAGLHSAVPVSGIGTGGFSLPGLPSLGLTGGAGGPAGPSSADAIFNDRSLVHVAPVGVNFGELFREMNSGPPNTGGFGFSISSPFDKPGDRAVQAGVSTTTLLFVAGGILLITLFPRLVK